MVTVNRIVKLIYNDVLLQKKCLLYTALVILIFLLLHPNEAGNNNSLFYLMLYVGGFVFTARSFQQLHQRDQAYHYLTLPVSNLERFVAKWLLTTIVYASCLLVAFWLFNLMDAGLSQLLFQRSVEVVSPLRGDIWFGIGRYVILQSIVLLGAATFRSNVLLKTACTLGCFLLLVSVVTVFTGWRLCPDCSNAGIVYSINLSLHGANFLFWCVLAPFCWLITYLKICETEIH